MKAKGYFRHLLKQHRAIVILYFAFSMIIYPISFLLQSFSREDWVYFDYSPSSLAIMMVVLGAVTPFIIFNFIFDKSKMDTYFALPVKREKLFLLQFSFCWLIQILPMLLSNVMGFVVVKLLTPADSIAHMGPYTLAKLLSWSGILILGSLMLQLPSMLAILATTNLFNGFVYALVLHLLPVTMQGAWSTSVTDYFGYTPTNSFADSTLTELKFHSIYVTSASQGPTTDYILALLIWFFAGLALLAFCTHLFKTHKVERTNTAYMLKGFYPALTAIFGSLLLLILLNSAFNDVFLYSDKPFFLHSVFMSIFLFAFVLFFIVEIIRYHGLPKIGRTILFYLIIFTVALGLSYFLNTTVKDTIVKEMPAREKVAKIELTSADYQHKDVPEQKGIFVYPFGHVTNYSQVIVEDGADIDNIMDIHTAMVDDWLSLDLSDRTHESKASYNNPHLRLLYLDDDGKQLMVRTYYVYNQQHRQALENISGIELLHPRDGNTGPY